MVFPMKIYSILDTKLAEFNTPFFAKNDLIACRSFGDLVRDTRSTVCQHPEDFILFSIGTFDPDSGAVSPESPTQVAKAVDFLAPVEKANA